MKYTQAKRRLMLFHILLTLSIVFTVLSIGCAIGNMVLSDRAYDSYIGISAATQDAERVASYKKAIQLCPEKIDGYLLLLDVYNEDGIFTQAESEEFLGLYNLNRKELDKDAEKYAQLHYRAGFLYANGYEDNTTSRLRMALPFFDTAAAVISEDDPNKLAVDSYNRIGKYYQDYIWDASSVREVSSEEMQALVEEIQTTITAYGNDESPESLFNRLGYYEAVCNLIYSQRDVLAVTVPYEDAQQALESIYSDLPDINTVQKEQVKNLITALETNKQMYWDMLNRAYSRKDGGGNAT